MAKRYVRTVRLERCAEQEVDLMIGQLAYQLAELSETQFPRSDNWTHEEQGEAAFNLEVKSGAFCGRVFADKQIDVEQAPGQGTRRKYMMRVSAECSNTKRKGARQLQLGMQHKMAVLFGVIGAIVVGVIATIAQIVALEGFSVRITIVVAAVGAVVFAGVGSFFGGSMGDAIGKLTSRSSAEEEDDYVAAAGRWETFIDELADVVDDFAQEVEESPSTATMI